MNNNIEYPAWFSEGKTTLLTKPGEFTSDNQRPITCVNTFYKWTTLCLLGPANELLETHGLIKVCTLFEQIQGLFKDSIQCKKEP